MSCFQEASAKKKRKIDERVDKSRGSASGSGGKNRRRRRRGKRNSTDN